LTEGVSNVTGGNWFLGKRGEGGEPQKKLEEKAA